MTRSSRVASTAAVLTATALPSALHAQERPTDGWLTSPVDESTFRGYLDFFVYGTDVPFQTEVLGTSTEEGVVQEHLSFEGTPGIAVTARLYRAQSVEIGEAPAIVYLHGGGIQGKDAAYNVRLNRFLARAGITVLAIDMWHFGERDDGLLGGGSEQEKHDLLYNDDPAYLEWIQQTVKEVSRSFDFLVQEFGADPARIGLVGVSRGAVVSTISGAADERFRAMALLHGGHFDFFEDGHRAAACPANYIGRIERPVLFLNSERDGDFLPETAIRPLHRLAGASAEVRWTEAGGHGAMDDDDRSAVAAWLRDKLR
jgi:dipeptidyl aminopeptidase/acylaminoacyl peptidase